MAVAFVFEAAGIGRAEYDGLMAALGRRDAEAPSPEGFIAHLAGEAEGGWRVVDVWASQAQADAFYGSDLFQGMLANAPVTIEARPWPLYRVEIDRTMREVASGRD